MNVRYTKTALKDLEALKEYTVAYFDTAQTKKILALLQETVWQLTQFPLLGRIGRVTGTREQPVPHTPFVVVYRVRDSTLEVITILHVARQWPV